MRKTTMAWLRRCACTAAMGGMLLQTTCQETYGELAIQQVSSVVSDTFFFFLDNFLVRLTA